MQFVIEKRAFSTASTFDMRGAQKAQPFGLPLDEGLGVTLFPVALEVLELFLYSHRIAIEVFLLER